MKYYAIKDNISSAIVTSWDECKELIKIYNNPKYKSFKTEEEAKAFLEDKILSDNVDAPKAYIDGSYDQETGCYSFGGVLIVDGVEYPYNRKFEPDEFSELRNVAGEIKGAGYIINYAYRHGLKELHIFYDYLGIEKWYTGEWKANSSIAKEYVRFANSVKDKINIVFHKVKSHTNDYYNEMADMEAKKALGL